MKTKIAFLSLFFLIFLVHNSFSDTVIINNAPNSNQPTQPKCNANQNDIYDPRVPPAGVYYTRNPDGSGTQTYTTGEKKPYITDNNCGGTSTPIVQPIIQPRVKRK